MSKRFDGKVAFITGAAAGFGHGLARVLSGEGALALADIDREGANRKAAELHSPAAPAVGLDAVSRRHLAGP